MLVLNAVGQIDAVRQLSDPRLDDMRGGRRAVWNVPFVIPVEQRGFFLRSRKRDSEFLIVAKAQRVSCKVADDAGNLCVIDWARVDRARFAGIYALRQELERTDAIAADSRQQAAGVETLSLRALGDAAPDRLIGKIITGRPACRSAPRTSWPLAALAEPQPGAAEADDLPPAQVETDWPQRAEPAGG